MTDMLQGSLVAIVTPMTAEGALDLPAFDSLIEWHIANGTHGIVVVGTTGESATLTFDEHNELVAYCVERVAGRLPVIAGTGSNNTEEAIYFSRSALQHGADACLLVTPYYNKPSQEGLYRHFASIADAVDIPQILYNVPGRTACDLSLETTLRLAAIDNIVAIKDATGDLERGTRMIEALEGRLVVLSGEDALTLDLMRAGAKGTITVTANVAPALMAKMCDLALAGDSEGAGAINRQLMPLHQALFLEGNPVPVKWALTEMGRIQSGIRLPLVELGEQFRLQVKEALLAADIKLESN